jgi:hypothetical protein
VLATRAGLKVSPEGLCKLSIWVQLLLGTMFAGSAPLRWSWLVVPTIAALLHIFNLVVAYAAEIRCTDYPWHVLKWTFPLGALAYCLAGAGEMARMIDAMGRISVFPILFFAVVYFIPSCLQTLLLWWRKAGNEMLRLN